MPLTPGRSAILVAATCVSSLVMFPSLEDNGMGISDVRDFAPPSHARSLFRKVLTEGNGPVVAANRTEPRAAPWSRRFVASTQDDSVEKQNILRKKIFPDHQQSIVSLLGEEPWEEDKVNEVTKLALAMTGKKQADGTTQHYLAATYEADGVMLPVKGSVSAGAQGDDYEGVREALIIAEASALGSSATQELIEAGALEALQILRRRLLSNARDSIEVYRAVANLMIDDEGKSAARTLGWVEVLESAAGHHGGAFGGRLIAEAKRALENLNSDGKVVYGDGLLIMHIPQNDQVADGPGMDVVFIHGLRGGALLTWRINEQYDPYDEELTIWPRDWLAQEFPNCRIISVEYDGRITNWTGKTIPLEEQATDTAELLGKAGVGSRPVIFVTHSYGGIVMKKIMCEHDPATEDAEGCGLRSSAAESIRRHFRGAVFFGTPHRGSPFAGLTEHAIVDSTFRPAKAVSELLPGAKSLALLEKSFKEFVEEQPVARSRIVSFGEGMETTVARIGKRKIKTYLVPPDSAQAGLGTFHLLKDANHLNICKPPNRDDLRYTEVRDMIRSVERQEQEEPSPKTHTPRSTEVRIREELSPQDILHNLLHPLSHRADGNVERSYSRGAGTEN